MTKSIYSIAPGAHFIEALAEGLWRECEGDLFKLSTARIFLPTRRACLALRDALLDRGGGKAALLPRMQPLGDIDDDELYFADLAVDDDIPPAITPLRRIMLLTRLVAARDDEMSYEQASQLATALARLLDEAQIAQCDFARLDELVVERDLAEHWKQTVLFLDILTNQWPKLLAAEGCLDPAVRRNRLLSAQAQAWSADPPPFRIIAAGSTGSIPATADLLASIASLPLGTVILPGLDAGLDEASWQAIEESHPQWGLKHLLEKLATDRRDVQAWNGSPPLSPRVSLLHEAMRPAAVTENWQDLRQTPLPLSANAGLTACAFDHPQAEAQAIALMMRREIETPEATAMLVTPDRSLAERVGVMLTRWKIDVNDSGGRSLALAPIGTFLTGLLQATSPGAGAVDYLALLKHPLAAFGLSLADCRARARDLEMAVWRQGQSEHVPWLDELKATFKDVRQGWDQRRPFADRLAEHVALASVAATTDQEDGRLRLWADEEGEVASTFFDEWRGAAFDFPDLTGDDYFGLFAELLRGITFRPHYGQHPRLSILGPLEARLIQADLTIIGGLNEGSWPGDVPVDPWMSRPMKRAFGLPAPEFRVGLAAHDFVEMAAAPRVILTRSKRAGNAPTIPSRFLLSLETVLKMQDADRSAAGLAATEPWGTWAMLLDKPDHITPCAKPQPRPASALRPQRLSVTDIGLWQHNPYAIYARYILKLKKLEALDAPVDASDRGTIIHETLDRFMKLYPVELPGQPLEALLAIGRDEFRRYVEHPHVAAFWWPRFARIAAWFVQNEIALRQSGIVFVAAEAKGHLVLKAVPFTITGRADRIDRQVDGTLSITDYKTGAAPSRDDVLLGLEPQLPLLALIARDGGFADLPAGQASLLSYWKMTGGRSIAAPQSVGDDIPALTDEARLGLEKLVTCFADPTIPYEAVPKPGRRPRFDDYAHLARHAEWGRTGSE